MDHSTTYPLNIEDQYVHLSADLNTIHLASWRVWYNIIPNQAGVFFSESATPIANSMSNQINDCAATAFIPPPAGSGGTMTVDQLNYT